MKRLGLCLLLTLFAASANAQMSIQSMMTSSFRGQGDGKTSWGELTMTGRTPIIPALLNAPFSGEESRKNEQVLSDGTHITQPLPMGAKVARDAQGRTRMERPLMAVVNAPGRPPQEPLMIVEINDPVEGYYYVVDPAKKIAYRVKYRPVQPRTIPPPRNVALPGKMEVKGSIIPGGQAPNITIEQLGSKFIQGVQAEGRRQTLVIPIGVRGNDRPVTEVHDTWTAPSLQLTILQTTKSPFGDTTYELKNFSAVNPTPDNFRPPPGYEVRDQPVSFTVEFGNRPAGAVATSSFSIGGGAVVSGATAPGTQR